MVEIKVKYFTDIDEIVNVENKSDWYDLRAGEDVELKAGEFKLIPLGVAIELPKGYEAIMAPRSSTFKNFGIIQANSIGIIDESYCGDNDMWRFPAIALRDTTIKKNERNCQFRILAHQPENVITKVTHLTGKDRGGLGSTSTK